MEKKIILPVVAAAVLWFAMFSPWTAPHLNFWYSMSCSAIILWIMSAWLSKDFKHKFKIGWTDAIIGIASAALLWVVFYIGDVASKWMFDFAAPQVSNIYQLKTNQNLVFVGLALAFIIGPAEEVFWRNYLQGSLTEKYGKYIAFIVTTIVYALVHIWSFNFMLVMAALVCGGFWGLMYMFRRNLTANIISHSLWDVAVFLIFPIGQ